MLARMAQFAAFPAQSETAKIGTAGFSGYRHSEIRLHKPAMIIQMAISRSR